MSGKPPVILIHGACSQPGHFDAWRVFFTAAGYDCIAPPLPGHAPSDMVVLRRQGFRRYLDAMRSVVASQDRRPVVIGHSLGGLIARILAIEGFCAAAVLVAPLPEGRIPAPAGAIPLYAALAPWVLAGRPFRPWRAAVRHLALNTLPRAEQDEIFAGFVAESGRAYRDLVLGKATIKRRALRCPMFVVHGDADRLIPLATARGTAAEHDALLTVIPGQGHWLIAPSLAPQVAGQVLRWIEFGRSAQLE
ncbi:MAG TPA: alpha/beta hydrolase [Bauldia sp.]|nr:alpha/beta hydrolase [Bauldia sp.]